MDRSAEPSRLCSGLRLGGAVAILLLLSEGFWCYNVCCSAVNLEKKSVRCSCTTELDVCGASRAAVALLSRIELCCLWLPRSLRLRATIHGDSARCRGAVAVRMRTHEQDLCRSSHAVEAPSAAVRHRVKKPKTANPRMRALESASRERFESETRVLTPPPARRK